MFLLQANRFHFHPKILLRSKAIWFGLEIVLDKIERFYIIQKLIDGNKVGGRRPDLLHPHLRKVLLEPVLHPLAFLGRGAVLLEDVMVISGYLSAFFDTIFYCITCSGKFKLSKNIVNSARIDVSIAHYFFHGTSGSKSTFYHGSCRLKVPVDSTLLKCVLLFLFMLQETAETVWCKRNIAATL